MTVAQRLRRKTNTTRMTRAIEISSVISTSAIEARIVGVRSIITDSSIACGNRGLQLRQQRAHAVDRLDDVGAGLPEDDEQHRRLAVRQPRGAHVLDRVLHVGDIGQAAPRAPLR